jgi:hypothetical protein
MPARTRRWVTSATGDTHTNTAEAKLDLTPPATEASKGRIRCMPYTMTVATLSSAPLLRPRKKGNRCKTAVRSKPCLLAERASSAARIYTQWPKRARRAYCWALYSMPTKAMRNAMKKRNTAAVARTTCTRIWR